MRRLLIYLGATFAISWSCWWILASQMSPEGSVFGSHLYLTLYLVGGFGPTIGALIAVALTPSEGGFLEFGARLTRWRVSPLWWLALIAVPFAIATGKEWIAIWAGDGLVRACDLQPFTKALVLFPTMILGGGLEELGWRGVAQPLVESKAPRMAAALIVGLIWALWHLPLFHIPGVSQSGRNFPLFAVDVLANAFLLAWIYAGTRSILLCVLFHAMSNTVTALGVLAIGPPAGTGAWIAVTMKLAAAGLLLALSPQNPKAQPAKA